MKYGLILEGGALRGMFTAGVMDVMMENHIEYDGAIGVSAGAAFGCNYKSRQIGRVIRYNERFANDPKFCSWRTFFRTGDIYGAEYDYHILPHELDVMDFDTYRNNPMEFWYVCTDLKTGKAVYHKSEDLTYDDLEWMRASASMPIVSRPVKVDGYELLDGGMADSIPLRYFESIGYRKNVVILTQPEGYVKKKNKMMPLIRVALRKYPRAVETMAKRHVVYNRQIKYVQREESRGRALVIRPDAPLNIGSMEKDPAELRRVYNLGRKAAEERLPEILKFLEGRNKSE